MRSCCRNQAICLLPQQCKVTEHMLPSNTRRALRPESSGNEDLSPSNELGYRKAPHSRISPHQLLIRLAGGGKVTGINLRQIEFGWHILISGSWTQTKLLLTYVGGKPYTFGEPVKAIVWL